MRGFVTMLLLGFLSTVAFSAVTLTFRDQVTVHGPQILLSDAATIEAADNELRILNTVVLGTAPAIGQQRTLTQGMIRMRLRQYYLNPDTMTLRGPETITICATPQVQQADVAGERAAQWLRAHMAPLPGEELLLTPVGIPATGAPTDGVTWACRDAGTVGTQAAVRITAMNGKTIAWETTVRFTVRRMADVLVARAALAAGALITAEQVTRERRDIAGLAGTAIRDVHALEGMRAHTALAAGSILCADQVEPIPVITRNMRITLTARCGGLVISLPATACEDGSIGATIRVLNSQTKRELLARVIAPGIVEVAQTDAQ